LVLAANAPRVARVGAAVAVPVFMPGRASAPVARPTAVRATWPAAPVADSGPASSDGAAAATEADFDWLRPTSVAVASVCCEFAEVATPALAVAGASALVLAANDWREARVGAAVASAAFMPGSASVFAARPIAARATWPAAPVGDSGPVSFDGAFAATETDFDWLRPTSVAVALGCWGLAEVAALVVAGASALVLAANASLVARVGVAVPPPAFIPGGVSTLVARPTTAGATWPAPPVGDSGPDSSDGADAVTETAPDWLRPTSVAEAFGCWGLAEVPPPTPAAVVAATLATAVVSTAVGGAPEILFREIISVGEPGVMIGWPPPDPRLFAAFAIVRVGPVSTSPLPLAAVTLLGDALELLR